VPAATRGSGPASGPHLERSGTGWPGKGAAAGAIPRRRCGVRLGLRCGTGATPRGPRGLGSASPRESGPRGDACRVPRPMNLRGWNSETPEPLTGVLHECGPDGSRPSIPRRKSRSRSGSSKLAGRGSGCVVAQGARTLTCSFVPASPDSLRYCSTATAELPLPWRCPCCLLLAVLRRSPPPHRYDIAPVVPLQEREDTIP
jgi:hypothetical protein